MNADDTSEITSPPQSPKRKKQKTSKSNSTECKVPMNKKIEEALNGFVEVVIVFVTFYLLAR